MNGAETDGIDSATTAACLEAAERIGKSRTAVAFTGAGISTESGIPDFRSPGGVWATSSPVLFSDFLADPSARAEYWRQKATAHRDFAASQPNAGHRVLARCEAAGLLRGVVTQNIDELHQQAGSVNVLELHGTARKVACLECAWRDDAGQWNERFLREGIVPDCPSCGGVIKHATVSFGQQLPPTVLMRASQWSRQADLFLAIGSSLVVEPAARLPRVARDHGACLIIINREPTPLDDRADIVIRDSIGSVLTAIESVLFRGKHTQPAPS